MVKAYHVYVSSGGYLLVIARSKKDAKQKLDYYTVTKVVEA